MGVRRDGRVAAVQILYEAEMQGALDDISGVLDAHFAHLSPESSEEVRAFAEQLCQGVVQHQREIDRTIERASSRWRLERMTRVDRNILRVAFYELLGDTPRQVVIDEAVELAKHLGTTESRAFVNGMLGEAPGFPRRQ